MSEAGGNFDFDVESPKNVPPTLQSALSPYRTKALHLPNGDAGIYATVRRMEQFASGPEGVMSPEVRKAALAAVRGSVRNVSELSALFYWVKNNIEFRGEADETLQTPKLTLEFQAGDCDDFAMLLVAMARSLGYDATFKTVAVAREDPTAYSHVYAVARDKVSGQWTPLDPTVRNFSPGSEPSDITRSRMYRSSMGRLRGLGDSTTPLYTDIASPVPIPIAPDGLSPTQSWLYNVTEPFAQAGASLLAHGQTPSVSANLGITPFGATGSSSTILIIAALAAVGIYMVSRR